MGKRHLTLALLSLATLIALFAVYANHFHNSFHFDDFHTIAQNPAIRSLANVPRFFTDASLFSVLPSHYSYRPIVSASLALDYWFAGGLNPFAFHVSTFVWYLAQLALMMWLFTKLVQNAFIALFATALYGLHPVSAETVNYIIQRGDLYSTLGVVAGLVIYCRWPNVRKWGLYLAPVILGGLSKQPALVFPAILFAYLALYESPSRNRFLHGLFGSLPALVVCGGLALFEIGMTPKTFVAGAASRSQYWMTQPFVALHYFKSFFLPTELSADTDRQAVSTVFSIEFLAGAAFLLAMLTAIYYTSQKRSTRPVAFGLFWFLVALLPTSVIPLAEVDNDHRMFFPFVGLVLAVAWTAAAAVNKIRYARSQIAATVIAVCLLSAYAYGSHLRNEVWRSEESLWLDVTEKSPRNGRGLMNYGLTQLGKGNAYSAYDYFQHAAVYTPNYSTLEINLGIAAGQLNRDSEAEQHFRRAISLAPEDSQSYSFFGRWLHQRGRTGEAIAALRKSADLNPADLDPRHILMVIYSQQGDWPHLKQVSEEVLRVAPNDIDAMRYSLAAQNAKPVSKTPEELLNLSLQHYQAGRFEECIQAAREALRLRPQYAEAYNNIAAANQSLRRWDEAIKAAKEAIRIKPELQLARNNLAYATQQKSLLAAKD